MKWNTYNEVTIISSSLGSLTLQQLLVNEVNKEVDRVPVIK